MSNQEKQIELVRALRDMFYVLREPVSEDQIMAYINYLREYALENSHSFDEVMLAIKKTGRELNYPPKVSDIIDRLGPSEEEVDAEVMSLASYEAQQALNDLMFSPSLRSDDETSQAVVEQIGFHHWKEEPLEVTKGKFLGLFISTYKKLKASEASGGAGHMALEEAKEKRERLAYYTKRSGQITLGGSDV